MKLLKKLLTAILVAGLLLVLAVVLLAFSLRATIPDGAYATRTSDIVDTRPVLIFGATRNTGLEVARILNGKGQAVTAAVRPTSDRAHLEALGVDIVIADALDAEAVLAAAGSTQFRAIVTTVGCMRCDPRRTLSVIATSSTRRSMQTYPDWSW